MAGNATKGTGTATKSKADPKEPEPGYEQALDELQAIVAELESGEVPLSEAMKLWERGEQLADICDKWLAGALERIEATQNELGEVTG
jgi:exodeoxyribonuclease VII small subunit